MSQNPQAQWTQLELVEVAQCQKDIMWMVLTSLLAMFFPFGTILTGIIQIYFIYKLAIAVRSSRAWLYIILAFIPLIGLIGLLHINGEATRTLQTNGIKVGIMGARMTDFDKIQEESDPPALPIPATRSETGGEMIVSG